jgi:hypothetical protein
MRTLTWIPQKWLSTQDTTQTRTTSDICRTEKNKFEYTKRYIFWYEMPCSQVKAEPLLLPALRLSLAQLVLWNWRNMRHVGRLPPTTRRYVSEDKSRQSDGSDNLNFNKDNPAFFWLSYAGEYSEDWAWGMWRLASDQFRGQKNEVLKWG